MHKIQVYLDDGRVFEYEVTDAAKAREHISAIVTGGWRHSDGKVFEHYPPHRILKVKSHDILTDYPSKVRGT